MSMPFLGKIILRKKIIPKASDELGKLVNV